MEERTRIVRHTLKKHYEETGESELSQADISKLVHPKLEESFPEDIRHTKHIKQALKDLIRAGELRALSSDGYELLFADAESDSADRGDERLIERSQTASGSDGTPDSGAPSNEGRETRPPISQNGSTTSELEEQSLFELVRSCQMGEAGAIVGGHIDRNALRQELYVETDEDELVTDFFADEYEQDGRCLIITGSAGDGKSALLSRAFQQAQQAGSAVEQSHIHMDATASQEKHQTYDDTLRKFLDNVSQCLEANSGPRTGLAINLGLAIDFFERQGHKEDYPEIWAAIDGARSTRLNETEKVTTLNLGHRSTYRSTPENLGSGLLRTLVEKFAFDQPVSPFHSAYERSSAYCSDPSHCPFHYNVELFTDSDIRETVSQLIAASGLINNVYLNPRAILDLVAKMLVPGPLQGVEDTGSECPVGDARSRGRKFDSDVLLPNAVFGRLATHEDRSRGYLDPAAQAGLDIDEKILEWSADPLALDEQYGDLPLWSDYLLEDKIRTKLRMEYLTGESDVRTARDWGWFDEFTGSLTFFDPPEETDIDQYKRRASDAVDTVTAALKGWTGDGNGTGEDWIEFVDGIKDEYTFLSKWEKPEPLLSQSRTETREETIPGQLWIVLDPGKREVTVPVPVTFELYVLMKRISRGYSPNARDLERSEGIRLLHSRLSEFTDKRETVRISNTAGEQLLNVDRDAFGTIQVEAGGDL